MSSSGFQPATLTFEPAMPQRSSLAHLLHALNQPLTGLQCLLELAMTSPRRAEEYIHTLREGLELTGRMRVLVEAIRELTDAHPSASGVIEFQVDTMVRDIVDSLLPVAESKNVRIVLANLTPLRMRADDRFLHALLFRFLESALSLTGTGSDLRMEWKPESERLCLTVCWRPGPAPRYSPFSPPELGLLVGQTGFERMGGEWICTHSHIRQTCKVRLPLSSPSLSNRGDLQ